MSAVWYLWFHGVMTCSQLQAALANTPPQRSEVIKQQAGVCNLLVSTKADPYVKVPEVGVKGMHGGLGWAG